MPYRETPDEMVAMRVRQLADDINEVDKAIHDTSQREGAAAPALLELYARRELLTKELLALHRSADRRR